METVMVKVFLGSYERDAYARETVTMRLNIRPECSS